MGSVSRRTPRIFRSITSLVILSGNYKNIHNKFKKKLNHKRIKKEKMESLERFELSTFRVETEYSNPLSYRDIRKQKPSLKQPSYAQNESKEGLMLKRLRFHLLNEWLLKHYPPISLSRFSSYPLTQLSRIRIRTIRNRSSLF